MLFALLAGCEAANNQLVEGGGSDAAGSSANVLGPPGTLVWAITSDPSPGAETPIPVPAPLASFVAMDESSLYVLGTSIGSAGIAWRVEKRGLIDGALVHSFGDGGVLTIDPSQGDDHPAAIEIGEDSLYLIGAIGQSEKTRIEKRQKWNGSLVSSFGNGGGCEQSGKDLGYYYRALLRPEGLFVALGGLYTPSIGKLDPSTCALTTGFGNGGWATVPIFDIDLPSRALVSDGSALYLAADGHYVAPSPQVWVIHKVSLTDGQASVGFGNSKQGTDREDFPDAHAVVLSDMVVAGGSLFAVGGLVLRNPNRDAGADASMVDVPRLEKRRADTGAFDPAFGTAGVVSDSVQGVNMSVAVDDAVYVLRGVSVSGTVQAQIEKRNLVDGALVSSFANQGRYTSSSSAHRTTASALALGPDAIYWVGGDDALGHYRWRIEKIAR